MFPQSLWQFIWGPPQPTAVVLESIGVRVWNRFAAGDGIGANSWEDVAAAQSNANMQDRAIVYVARIIDRQLNKCRGILTFNGILLASVKLAADSVAGGFPVELRSVAQVALAAGAVSLLLSSLVLLNVLVRVLGTG